jgi:hypothetical protein
MPLRPAAGDRDVDFLRLKHLHDFVGCGFQTTGVGLDTCYRQGPQQGLHPLVVPIFARGEPRMFGEPIDQLLLCIHAALGKSRATIGSMTSNGGKCAPADRQRRIFSRHVRRGPYPSCT